LGTLESSGVLWSTLESTKFYSFLLMQIFRADEVGFIFGHQNKLQWFTRPHVTPGNMPLVLAGIKKTYTVHTVSKKTVPQKDKFHLSGKLLLK